MKSKFWPQSPESLVFFEGISLLVSRGFKWSWNIQIRTIHSYNNYNQNLWSRVRVLFFCILSSFRSSQEWIFCGKIHKRLCLLNWSFVCPWTISYANHAFEVLRYLRKIKNPLHLILPFELMIKYKKKFLFQIWYVCWYTNTLFIITFINNRNISDELLIYFT